MKIKVNDKVVIRSGKEKTKMGKIIQVFPQTEKVVVEGLHLIKRHVRSRGGEKGQVLELAGPIAASKVSLMCPKCGKGCRVRYKMDGTIKKRICTKCGEFVE